MTFAAFTGKVYNADLKFSQAGKAYFTCTVQERHREKNRETGQYENGAVTWHRVTYFGNKMFTPEALAETAVDGSTVVVFGNSNKREFQKKDGSQGESQEIIPDAGCVGVVAVAPEYADQNNTGAAQSAQGGNRQASSAPQGPQQAGWNQAPQQGGWGPQVGAQGQWGNQEKAPF